MLENPYYLDEEAAAQAMTTLDMLMQVDSFEGSLEQQEVFRHEYLLCIEYLS